MKTSSTPRAGPLVRASVFVVLALIALRSPIAASEEVRRLGEGRAVAWPAVWLVTLVIVALFGFMAWRIVREAFPPADTRVFPVLPVANITIVDVLVAPFAWLMMLSLALFPQALARSWGEFRGSELLVMLIIVPMGAALVLWRPSYHVTRGQPLVRYPAGAWLPWRKVLPIRPRLVWRDFWAGKPRRQIGWGLYAVMGRFEIFLELVDLESAEQLKDTVRAEWAEFFSAVKEGTPEEIAAALDTTNDKPVKPWHIMAAMFGLPATPLAVVSCFQKHWDNVSMGVTLLAAIVAGGLAIWFLSRFVSEKTVTGLMAVLVAVSVAGVLYGRREGMAEAVSHRVGYQIEDVCEGKPSAEPLSAEEPVRFASSDGPGYKRSAPDGTRFGGMPRAVGCIIWSGAGNDASATVTLRSSRTAEFIATRSFPPGTSLDAMAKELATSFR